MPLHFVDIEQIFRRLGCPADPIVVGVVPLPCVRGGGGFQFFELKLHLLQQPRRAFRAGAIKLAPQLLNLELEPADERFSA